MKMQIETSQGKDGYWRWTFRDAEGPRAVFGFRPGVPGFKKQPQAEQDAWETARRAGREIAGLVEFTDRDPEVPPWMAGFNGVIAVLAALVLGVSLGATT